MRAHDECSDVADIDITASDCNSYGGDDSD